MDEIKPCVKCGAQDRYEDGHCKPCHRANSNKYRNNNVEGIKAQNKRRYERHREKYLTNTKEWHKKNPGYRRASMLRRNYGITVEAWNNLVKGQDYCCAVCGTRFDITNTESMHTDHDHQTGFVRGVLCSPCNLGLGHFEDNPCRLEAAAEYLRVRRGTA